MQMGTAVLRIFEVRAKSGCAERLQQKLSVTSVDVVSGKPGNLGYLFGAQLAPDENDLVFISLWRDMESVRSHFGDDWCEAFLPEGYADLIDHCSIRHVECEGRLMLD